MPEARAGRIIFADGFPLTGLSGAPAIERKARRGEEMRILSVSLLAFLVAGCARSASGNDASADSSDHLRAGRWSLVTTLGTPQGIRPGGEPPLVIPHCLGAAEAERPAGEMILAMASRDRCTADGPRFANGTISGTMQCQGMDDIPEHRQQMSGSYSSESFRLTIDMPVHGATVRQTIQANRTGDC
jgi:Protein of unknown function (DUF3617)